MRKNKYVAYAVMMGVLFSLSVFGTAFADDQTFVQGTTFNGLGVSVLHKIYQCYEIEIG